jgi:hypothetical protein
MDKPYEAALREYAKVVGISLEQAKYEHALAIQQGLAPPRHDTEPRDQPSG